MTSYDDFASDLGQRSTVELRELLHKWESRRSDLMATFPQFQETGRLIVYQYGSPAERDFFTADLWVEELKAELIGRGDQSETIGSLEAEQQGSTGASGVARGGGNWFDSDPNTVRRRQIVLTNPKMSSKSLCKVFDGVTPRIPFPRDWQADLAVKTWSDAYANPKGRNRIQKIISTDKRAGKQPGRS